MSATPDLWLEGDTGVTTSGGLVSQWADTRSGNGLFVAQSNEAQQPGTGNTLNGLNVLTFSASVLSQATAPWAQYPGTIMAVIRPTSLYGPQAPTFYSWSVPTICGFDAIYWGLQINDANLQYYYYDGNAELWIGGGTLLVNTPYLITANSAAGGSDLTLNGSSQGSSSNTWRNQIGGSGQIFNIGQSTNYSPYSYFVGDIAAVLLWATELSSGDKTYWENYLSRWSTNPPTSNRRRRFLIG